LAQHFHPEFGYLYPTPRFRRDLRVSSAAFVVGAVLCAIAVAVSTNYREAHTSSAAYVSSARADTTETADGSQCPNTAERQPAERGCAVVLETSNMPASQVSHTPAVRSEALVAKDARRDHANLVPLPKRKPFAAASVNAPRKLDGAQKRQQQETSGRAASLGRSSDDSRRLSRRVYARDSSYGRTVFWE
jgi:hypothetical protein